MKILLTHGYFLKEDEKEKLIMKPYVPLGILYISAYLEQHGFDNEVFDSTFAEKADLFAHIAQSPPAVIGIYTNLMTKLNVLEIIRHIRTHHPATRIILGGPEVRASAEKFLRHGADIIVLGEGEETMLQLVQHFNNQQPDALLTSIDGIAFLLDDELVQTPERKKIPDIDVLPFPNRHKVNLHLYLDVWKQHHGKNAVSVSTMRGCPYTCKWCSRAVYGGSYRRRSPELVADELEAIYRQYAPDSIWFVDDVFTIHHRWLSAFNAALKKKKLRISYECITRADRLNEEVIAVLKDSGCFRVWIGAESGSQQVIDLMDRRVKVEQVRDMIRLASSYGIETGTFIMLGYPGETETDIKETIHHLRSSNPDHFTITVAYPIAGTPLFEEIQPFITTQNNWDTSTDRNIDFKRTYPKPYYKHAVQHVVTSVNAYKLANKGQYLRALKQQLIAAKARLGMQYYKLLGGRA